jgi:hypothetical protein
MLQDARVAGDASTTKPTANGFASSQHAHKRRAMDTPDAHFLDCVHSESAGLTKGADDELWVNAIFHKRLRCEQELARQ